MAVVIDPGHGGRDSGACANGLAEKDVVFNLRWEGKVLVADGIANRLAHKLRLLGVTAELTREADVYLTKRQRWAKVKPDTKLYISVHCNAAVSEAANGVEVYYSPFAYEVAKRIAETLPLAFSRHSVRKLEPFSANRRVSACLSGVARIPSLLVECGFITNIGDANILRTKTGREQIATILSLQIWRWLNRA